MVFLNANKQTIKVHFDMHHGFGNLDKAINLLDDNQREQFREYVNTSTSFNPHIMFIAKPKVVNEWFNNLFSWLFKAKNIFNLMILKVMIQKDYTHIVEDSYLSGLKQTQIIKFGLGNLLN